MRHTVASATPLSADHLTHDFGVVPRAVVSWAYPVQNISDFVWTVEKVHVLCRCTVPGVSSPTIAPGESERVVLELSCGEQVADIAKTATVHFKEVGVPPVRLVIKASVRAPMTPSVREVSFGSITPGLTAEQAITLGNYSQADWREVRAEGCPDWAELLILPPRPATNRNARGESPVSPRQTWHACVRFTGEGLADGYCLAPITMRADSGDECRVYVSARVEPPVRIVPEKLVFGPARPNESCVRVARLIIEKGTRVSAIQPHADTEYLSVDLRPIGGQVWQLTATLVVPSAGRVPDGRIGLSFPRATLAEAALPYSFFDSADAP